MMDSTEPFSVQDQYFYWLCDPFYDNLDPASWFITVFKIMHETVFLALVPHDENRIADAAGLRNEFLQSTGTLGPLEEANLLTPDASVFEVLIALAKRADFMVPLGSKIWMRVWLENLKLDRYTDTFCEGRSVWPIRRVVNTFNNRSYSQAGKGGIFPLRRPRHNQREVELWYQMGAYMTENAMY